MPGDRLRAERPDHVWAFDFQFDVTEDGRAVKLLYVVDEFTREALAMEAERRIDGDRVVDVLEGIVAEQGRRPELVRCDNGPEMTSNALRDWCRFCRTGAAFIEPGSPWENPFVESFNSRVRDELLSVEVFSCLAEAKVMVEDFRQDYNRCRPHRAHGMMTPAAFKAELGEHPRGRARQRRTPPPLRAGSVRRRRQPYPAGTNHPPALTAGGPMNRVRSVFARHAMNEIRRDLEDTESSDDQADQINVLLAGLPNADPGSTVRIPARVLLGIKGRSPLGDPLNLPKSPATPFSQSDLLINAEGQPNIGSELKAELAGAETVDLFMLLGCAVVCQRKLAA